ncbi:MAG TPA: adenine deaminase [Pseudogracilibacillus sp.]|nr:adenine deaminase [Pseudogracilibacillus sp.]
MNIEREQVIAAARGDIPMDLVIRGANLVNVFTAEIYQADVGVKDGRYSAIATYKNNEPSFHMTGEKEVNAKGKYIMPGFIDAHVHIESTLVTPDMFASEVIRHGTTTAVIDPHEMANVLGVEGVTYMIEASQGLPVQILTTIPSSVPAVPGLEYSGAEFYAEDIAELFKLPGVVGIAELMDFPGVIKQSTRMSEIVQTGLTHNMLNEGHAPRVSGRDLQAYLAAGVNSDHESRSKEEVLEKLRAGMMVYIRESSASQFAHVVAEAWQEMPYAINIAMCTDDVEPNDMFHNGQMNRVVRRTIEEGVPAALAIRFATLGGAMRYGLRDQGAIAPGYLADFLLVDSLETMKVNDVYIKGEHTVKDNKVIKEITSPIKPLLKNTVHILELTEKDFFINAPIDSGQATLTTIEFTDIGTTVQGEVLLDIENGVVANLPEDFAYVTVINRHGRYQKPFIGVVKNAGIKDGAYATTMAHDSHNLVVVGKKPADMLIAANKLKACGGGLCLAQHGEVLAYVELPIAGLMSPEPISSLAKKVEAFNKCAIELGVSVGKRSPAMAFSSIALTVIPDIRMSDLGLVDVVKQELIPLFKSTIK